MNWPLSDSNFTFADRLRICRFFLRRGNFWTADKYVADYERAFADFMGTRHAVFVSSGSAANTILAMLLKATAQGGRKIVVFPSTTWITSVSPFIREGFEPRFIDVNLTDFSIDLGELEAFLKRNAKRVALVFITSLVGFQPDMDRVDQIERRFGVRVMFDNCENTLTAGKTGRAARFCRYTSTTSTYFGHQTQSVEGGFIFTNSNAEHEFCLMARNHGLTRSLPIGARHRHENPDVDPRFDFAILGNNFRNTDINAFIGMLDFKRVEQYARDRIGLYEEFRVELIQNRATATIPRRRVGDVPFCLPILFREAKHVAEAKAVCGTNGIEFRPIISGNLLRQTCLKGYSEPLYFKNSEAIHTRGLYVGLHSKVERKALRWFAQAVASIK